MIRYIAVEEEINKGFAKHTKPSHKGLCFSSNLREAAKKVIFLMAVPLRPYPLPQNGTAIKKITFSPLKGIKPQKYKYIYFR